jgi:hypothetical protein
MMVYFGSWNWNFQFLVGWSFYSAVTGVMGREGEILSVFPGPCGLQSSWQQTASSSRWLWQHWVPGPLAQQQWVFTDLEPQMRDLQHQQLVVLPQSFCDPAHSHSSFWLLGSQLVTVTWLHCHLFGAIGVAAMHLLLHHCLLPQSMLSPPWGLLLVPVLSPWWLPGLLTAPVSQAIMPWSSFDAAPAAGTDVSAEPGSLLLSLQPLLFSLCYQLSWFTNEENQKLVPLKRIL